ncbi:MAG: ATP-binding protein [Actinomycetota bacterium]
MNWRSVRFRLTALVAAVAAIAMVLAATLGVGRIERSLVDDVLADTAAQTIFIDGVIVEGGGEAVEVAGGDDGEIAVLEDEFFADDLLADEVFRKEIEDFFVPQLEESVAQLERTGGVDALLAEMGRSRADGLPVLQSFGVVIIVGLDGAPSTVFDAGPADFGEPVAFEFNLSDVAFAAFEVDVNDIFENAENAGLFEDPALDALLEERFDEAAAAMDVEATTVEVDGIEFAVAADTADVKRSVDKLRSILYAAGPVLVIAAALATWILTTRALSPVRRMSRQVAVISGGTLHERVPVPNTGDEIQELGDTMNAMLDRLEGDDQRLRQFVSDASHELRSPVAVLRSEAEVALRSPDDTETAELAEGVLGESLRLEQIVADLLVLARGDEARGALPFTPVDLDDIVLTEAARRRKVPVDTKAVSGGQVMGTRDGCGRIVVHLLDNAARHASSAVAVGVRTDGEEVSLWVDDDGPGVPVADRDRVFERFTRLEAARTRDTGGAGLGLAVVASTVAAMGGTVEVDDAPLGGARFLVRWPVAAR